jgi:hypothetical protein
LSKAALQPVDLRCFCFLPIAMASTISMLGLAVQAREFPSVAPSAAFYVAVNGDDDNDGTTPATGGGHGPFATLTTARAAMQAGSIKTTYIRAGIYTPAPDGSAPATNCTGNFGNVALYLGPSDAGETWSYYPPDHVDSAIVDGGASSHSTGLGAFTCIKGSNITINGLQLQHYANIAINITGDDRNHVVDGTKIINNIVHDTYANGGCNDFGAIHNWYYATNTTISNNYVYNAAQQGISAFGCTSGTNISGLNISNNVTINTCKSFVGIRSDCGAIYVQENDISNNTGYPVSTDITIKNNFCRDVSVDSTPPGSPPQGVATCFYLDDAMSNVTATGNIATGYMEQCFVLHGGDNDTITGNICDWGSGSARYTLLYQTGTNAGPTANTSAPTRSGSTLIFLAVPPYTTGFVLADETTPTAIGSGCTVSSYTATQVRASCSVSGVGSGDKIRFIDPMVDNVVSGNIIVNAASSVAVPGFHGYYDGRGKILPPNPQTSAANDFYSYGAATPDHTGALGAARDRNPQNVNPQLSGCYGIASGSPVFRPPTNFPGIIGGWGPPGFRIPIGSYKPSYPSPSC